MYADVSRLVTSVLDGYNVCIFAYGQTGTGKTFTMEGTQDNRGVNYRTLQELFEVAEKRKECVRYDFFVSVLEVYNDAIRDLLATDPSIKYENLLCLFFCFYSRSSLCLTFIFCI